MTILVDTSFLYALYNASDASHARAQEFAASASEVAIVPDVVLPEVGFLFLRDIGIAGVQRFMEQFAGTTPHLAALDNTALKRAAEIMQHYDRAAFDVVDCCIMAIAERMLITRIATFDRRDFSIFRPRHCDYFDLKP